MIPWRGHGNLLQYSCLENPMDRGAWRATVLGVTQSQTQLKQLTMHTTHNYFRTLKIKIYSKFSKPGFSSTWTVNFQMFKLALEKAEEPEIKLPTSIGSSKKQESSRKTSISALSTMPKPLTVWITLNCGKFWKRWEYQTTFVPLEKPVCRSESNS